MDHVDVAKVARDASRAANRLAKWRTWFASWQLGTRPADDGECRAVKDHREATILMRAEVNAITRLLLDKGLCTQVELTRAFTAEYELLDKAYAERYPGVQATDQGLAMDPVRALETMKELGFPK